MVFVAAPIHRLSVRVPLPLVMAAGLMLASLVGCSSAVTPDDSQQPEAPQAPEESSPPDDGPLRLGVAADTRAVVEGDAATFTVTAVGAPSTDPVLVDYTVSGTASADRDYTLPSSTTTLGAGALQAKIAITTLADYESEPRETITVALERASTAARTVEVDTTPATVSIADPGTAIVAVAPATAQEGEQAAFVVTVSVTLRSNVTVGWKTVDGTAAAGADSTAEIGGTVVFGSGSTRRQTIRVATVQDQLDEADETFEVVLTGVSPSAGVSLGRATATGTIADDDQPPVLTIEDRGAMEDAGSMSFRVLLAPASGRLVTVSYRTEDDTASAGPDSDYTGTGGTLRFTPGGPLAQSIRVVIADDSDDEADEEYFTVTLSSPVNATLGDAEATGTITDNDDSGQQVIDGPPRLDIADSRAGEGDGIMLFTVTLNRPSAQVVSVFYETDGTAHAHPGSDYTKTEGELIFSLGGTLRQTIAVPILQDDLDEGTGETFTVKLLDPVNAVLGDDTATGVIVDDDDAPADDHGDTRATATAITQGSPISGRLETAADIDFFKVAVTSSGTLYTATDVDKVGAPGYPAGTVVRIETSDFTSTNDDSFDATSVDLGLDTSAEAYVRVSGASATRYDLAVWLTASSESDASFDIELRYLGTQPTSAQKNTIRAAADVWESVIASGQPFRIVISSEWECEDRDPSTFGDYIDDLRIDVRLERIDGSHGAVAIAGPCVSRRGGLPLIGDVAIDTADLGRIGTEGLGRVAVHEMAHVLGYGTKDQWYGLLRNSAVEHVENNPDDSTLPDTHFTGQAAVSAFDELLDGATYSGAKVPVENNTVRYGAGGLDGHWREAVFEQELMTSTISTNPLTSQPLSKLTIAALADLGYRVDYAQADSYSLPSATQSLLRVQSGGDEVHLGDHIRRGPVIVAEIPE